MAKLVNTVCPICCSNEINMSIELIMSKKALNELIENTKKQQEQYNKIRKVCEKSVEISSGLIAMSFELPYTLGESGGKLINYVMNYVVNSEDDGFDINLNIDEIRIDHLYSVEIKCERCGFVLSKYDTVNKI